MLATLVKVFEKSELNHASLPRQHTCLKLYGHLCRVFDKTDALILRVKPLMQKSPAWTLLSGDKKAIAAATGKKDFIAHLAHLGAMFHTVRFHMSYGEQETMLELLFQAAFLPSCVASRHAAATLLQLFELSNEHAKTVVKAFEWYLMKFRPTSLRVGDTLATVYLLRLAGQISRLPTTDDSSGASSSSFSKGATRSAGISVSNLLDFSYDTGASSMIATSSPSPPPSPIARQRQRLDGVKVSSALATRLKDMLLDLLCAAAEQKASSTAIPNTVVLVAIEETVKDSNADACILKVRGSVSVFEIVASVLLRMLRDAIASTVLLHRLCRAIQFTAECLDGAVLQLTASAHQPQFLDKITERVVELAAHANPFIACESLRALVWLLPRLSTTASSGWDVLMTRLMDLPVDQICPEARSAIADAFFHRAVTNPSLNDHAIDTALLHKCLSVTLSWFQTAPCAWHAPMLVRIWHTALRKALSAMGDAVFASLNAVLDFQHHQRQLRDTTELVNRSTLAFLARVGAAFAVRQASWFHALVLRLTKQMLLESLVSRRLSVQVMTELAREAQQIGKSDIVEHVAVLLAYLERSSSEDNQLDAVAPNSTSVRAPDVFVRTRVHSQSVKDVLGIQDLLLLHSSALEVRAPALTGAPRASVAAASSPFFSSAAAMALDGVF